jgi:hypothetical protein
MYLGMVALDQRPAPNGTTAFLYMGLYTYIHTHNDHISRKSGLMRLKEENMKAISNELNYGVGWSQLTICEP